MTTLLKLYGYLFLGIVAAPVAPALAAEKADKIRLLTWWNYTDPKVVAKLKTAGFEVDTTVYKSNEAGLSRLMNKSNPVDIAVVSNEVLPLLLEADLIEPRSKSVSLSEFEEFTKPARGYCVPYLWGSSAFAYDSRKVKAPPKSLRDLVALKSGAKQIAIDDDSFIVAARILGDNLEKCERPERAEEIFSRVNTCPSAKWALKGLPLAKQDFRTNLDGFYAEEAAVASYGWHGVVAAQLDTYPWLRFEPAELNPIIGLDYACILKQGAEAKISLKRKAEFLKLLTDEESTHWNVAYSQYFSPRKGDTVGLKPKVKDLRARIMQSIGRTQAISITPPDADTHKFLNGWWQAVRYGK